MSLPADLKTLTCEQCGAPLQSREGHGDCLNCLLTAGIDTGESDPSASAELPRTRFYQQYEILAREDGSLWELGRGAMGVTYKARHVSLDTTVALKIINPRLSARPDARSRFLYEARAAARLRHPNVASVFDFGTINSLPPADGATSPEETADAGDCFYAMEFIDGETLETRLRRDGALTPREATEIGLQVARALAAAERRGLVHRDLKPSNIMLARDQQASEYGSEGWVKVIDFGVAKPAAEAAGEGEGRFFGTVAFSSPEQLQRGAVDIRSDIFSLGATLWYALTGTVPFGQRSLTHPSSEEAAPDFEKLNARKLPPPLIDALRSMLSPDPEERPASGMAAADLMQHCLDELSGSSEIRRQPPRPFPGWAIAAGLAVAAGLAILAIYPLHPKPPAAEKSIAVLPFQNLSNDPNDAFFAVGLQDDLLSSLAKIKDLEVISRSGTVRYPANLPRDLPAIGRALSVRRVVEGSVERSGDRLLLRISLVDTRDGRQVWTDRYDFPIASLARLHGEIASAIAGAMDAEVSVRENNDVRATPTHNPDAYVLYLRGRILEDNPDFSISEFRAARALYMQAITLDPGFALAHAGLASTLALLYRFEGPSEDLKAEAYAEARTALRLRPDLGEAHLVSALCAYRLDRDFAHAVPELITANRLLPNDTEAESFMAYILRRQGHFLEARAGLERCLKRDPRNAMYEEELYTTSYLLRDWAAAAQHAERAEQLAPNRPLFKVQRALVSLWRDGDLRPLQEVFSKLQPPGDMEGKLTWMRWDAAMLARDFAGAQAALDRFPLETLPSVETGPIPKSYLEGCIALASGDKATARQKFETARPDMEADSLAHPENALRHARLGLLYAYMGRKSDALREGERAVELQPIATDAFDGPENLCNLALIHAWVGDTDEAVKMVHDLLRTPGGVFFYQASMSIWELRLRWQWDPLRKDPRFQEILAGPEPPTRL